MSFYKPRIGRTNPSGHPIHPGPGDHEASASSAHFPQLLDPSLSDATPAAARQADLVCPAPSLGYVIDNTGAFSWTGPATSLLGNS